MNLSLVTGNTTVSLIYLQDLILYQNGCAIKGTLYIYLYVSILDMGCVSIVCHLVTKHSVSHE